MLAKPGMPNDLVLAVAFSVICGLISWFAPQTPGLWLPTIISVFFLPGYCALSAIAPGKGFLAKEGAPIAIATLERVIASIMLSIFFIAIISTVLSWSDWGLTTASAAIEVSGLTVLASIIALLRRSRLPAAEQFTASIEIRSSFRPLNRLERGIAVAAVIVLVASTTLALTANMNVTEPYAQLTITGASGTLSDLPQTVSVDQEVIVRVTILNKMNTDLVYNLTVGVNVSGGFTSFQTLDWFSTNTFPVGAGFVSDVSIANGHSYSANLVFRIPSAGPTELLFLLNGENVHRDAWLFLTVT
ncbi:MAG: DUF1616 domain-containing protein [Methanomassiliicoccales archaeon]|nr:DUF1616 domain-containing protein [Methanomassiliicoccales archaeon]